MPTNEKFSLDYDDYRALRKGLIASGSKTYEVDSHLTEILSCNKKKEEERAKGRSLEQLKNALNDEDIRELRKTLFASRLNRLTVNSVLGVIIYPHEEDEEGRVRKLNFRFSDPPLQKAFPFLTKLKHLEHLDVTDSDIASIPEDIGELISLKTLYLGANRILEVPPSFGRLKNLRALDLSWTDIQALPKEFGDLTNLMELCLPLEFPFQSCLDLFGNLTSLMYLEVSLEINAMNLLNVQGRAQNLLSLVHKCQLLGSITASETFDLGTEIEYALASNRAKVRGTFMKNGAPPKLWPHVLGSAAHAVAEYARSPIIRLKQDSISASPMPIADIVYLILNANIESFAKVLIDRSRIGEKSSDPPSRKRRKKRSPTSRKKLR